MSFERLSTLFKSKNKDVATLPDRSATSKTVDKTLPYGLITLADGIDPVVDIVAIHGLDGHREKSWTVDNVNWLHDLLPTDIPNARIMSWGYDARTHSFSHIGGKYIYDHGKTLVSDLCLKRALTNSSRRPIIFVAHSLGGIVLKSALIHSEAARKDALGEHRSIKVSTYGIMFMGSPNQGAAGVQLGEIVRRIASVFMTTDKGLIKHIERDSEWLQQQLQQYAPISQEFVTKFAYETFPTTTIAFGKKMMIVPQASAVVPGTTDGEPIAIPADHVNIVKFASRQDVGYGKVSGHFKLMAAEAPDIVRARWDTQDKIENILADENDDFSVPFSLYGVPDIQEFVGRRYELKEIKEAFYSDGSERTVVVLHGLGGIGKTQLIVRFLKKHKDKYSSVFWLNGRTEDTLKQSFASMAGRLQSANKASPMLKEAVESKNIDEVIGCIKKWLSITENYRWMLVFDNIDNPKVASNKDPQAYDVRNYFPEAYHGSIIVTTRSSSLNIGRIISLRKLQEVGEGVAILASASGRQNLDKDTHAKQLAIKLDGLPLALATAGAYLGQVSTSLEDYLRFYTESWLKLQMTSPELLSYEDRTLYSTWNLSFEHIKSRDESAAQLLRLWAYFDNQDVWYQFLAAGRKKQPKWFADIVQDELSFNFVVRLLCDHGLVEPFDGPGGLPRGYGMHSCVHNWCKFVLGDGLDIEMGRTVLSCVGSMPMNKDPESRATQRRLLPHASRCTEVLRKNIEEYPEQYREYSNDIFALAWLFDDQDKLKDAEFIYHRSLEVQKMTLGPEHSDTLTTVVNLGSVYYKQNMLKETETMYQQALEGFEETLGPDHSSTLEIVNNLGSLYRDQGKLNEAEAMFQRALNGIETSLGPEHSSTLETVGNLGLLYQDQGKWTEAQIMLQRALDGKENTLGPRHDSTLDAVNNLGMLYLHQGKVKEAEVMLLRVLDAREISDGPEHFETLDCVNNLGLVYRREGKSKEAEVMLQRALNGYEKVLGPWHPSTLLAVHNLGVFYSSQGKLEEAEAMYQRALAGKEKSHGPEHTATLQTVYNLGDFYRRQSRWEESEAMYQRALRGFERALGPEHYLTLDTVNNLGVLYMDQDMLSEAESQFQRALVGKEKSFGPEHDSTLLTVDNFSVLYRKQGKMKEAEAMYQRTLDTRQKTLGPTHELTLKSTYNLMAHYVVVSGYEKATALILQALKDCKKGLGPESPEASQAVSILRELYTMQDKPEEADALLKREGVGGPEQASPS